MVGREQAPGSAEQAGRAEQGDQAAGPGPGDEGAARIRRAQRSIGDQLAPVGASTARGDDRLLDLLNECGWWRVVPARGRWHRLHEEIGTRRVRRAEWIVHGGLQGVPGDGNPGHPRPRARPGCARAQF